jgi:hypothetical protein
MTGWNMGLLPTTGRLCSRLSSQWPFCLHKVLHQTLKELHQALDLRASTRLLSGDLGDDGLGSKTVLGNFHDDGAMLVPHCDFHFVYQEFDRIGTPHGLRTNWDKSGALVTLDPSDVPTNQDYLDGISLLLPSKIYTHGTTFLGTPLGHPSFIHSHLMEVADEFDKQCKGLQSQLDDLQTITSLFHM